ncbi:MAG: cytochrome c3 family protein [Vicinamibacterales bacterium]
MRSRSLVPFCLWLVSLLALGGVTVEMSATGRAAKTAQPAPPGTAAYVGSAACATCHRSIYDRWAKTRMANVVRDPKVHPDAIIPDLSVPNPLVTFTRDQIAFTYGSKWKQRYFTKIGDDYYPFPAQWDVTNKVWRPYVAQPNTEWWLPHYPPETIKRPTGPLCDGCHSVNYDIRTKTVTEWNVGCEKCHGPGGNHVKAPGKTSIVNPGRLDTVQAVDVCVQCHSQGKPLVNPQAGAYFDWPVGFHVGQDLKDFWELEEHTLGETTFTHYGDGTSHKNRMQGNDFAQSLMYTRGVTCAACHDVHGTAYNADLRLPAQQLCLTCHGSKSPNGPHAASVEAHTHHPATSAGSECIACHMPKTSGTIANVSVRSHTFRFITPGLTDTMKVPNPCLACHADKDTAWVRTSLRAWGVSPWRAQ